MIAAACSFPGMATEPPPTPASVETISTETPVPTPTATPPPTATPAPPDGWTTVADERFSLRFHAPASWRYETRNEVAIDLRDDASGAWLEIQRLTPGSASAFGIPYSTGIDSLTIIENLLGGLRQDGQFDDPGPVLTRTHRAAYFAVGYYELYGERIMVAAWGLPDRAFILVGHEPLDGISWENALGIYQGIINSLIDTTEG